ncbi:hypothetical protein KDL01_20655 [Actinospica durhamensis]|uniref:Uncharacterized protein n=1 Tax=Actinospica durhamensis TaxID=1508375 RepID=A0A941EXD9_9ACTN|nr:hypothetical protein [Actinospica durhamensis]MBR7835699.1 hypothetical protein [Actinospica durhamensis]
MSPDLPELSAKLEQDAAAGPIPPSRIDLDRACQDGYRSRRNRRALTTVTGVGTVGLCAALAAVFLPHALGTADNAATGADHATSSAVSPAASAPTPAASGFLTYTATVPASFGWLPDNVDYIITGPPSAGDVAFSARASGFIPGTDGGSAPSAGRASVYLTLSAKEATASSRSKLYRIAGPAIGSAHAQSYWITRTAGDKTNGGDATLEWQTASGQWAEVDGSDLGGDPLLATVEHIADTVHVGATDVALPLQIKSLPGAFSVSQVVLTEPAHTTDSSDWSLFTSYTLGQNGASGQVYVVAQGTDVGRLTGVGPQSTNTSSGCKTTGGIVYCATTTYSAAASADSRPTAAQLLGDVTLLGNDQSTWSSDLLVR